MTVTASAPGMLNAWLDFNGDGDWADAGEQIFTGESVVAGANALTFTIPAGAVPAGVHAVTVTDPPPLTCSSTDVVELEVVPSPTVSAITPASTYTFVLPCNRPLPVTWN